jgi:hypothetical protein
LETSSFPFKEAKTYRGKLRCWRPGTASDSRHFKTLEALPHKGKIPSDSSHRSQEPTEVYNNKRADKVAHVIVRNLIKIQLQNSLSERTRQRSSGRIKSVASLRETIYAQELQALKERWKRVATYIVCRSNSHGLHDRTT